MATVWQAKPFSALLQTIDHRSTIHMSEHERLEQLEVIVSEMLAKQDTTIDELA